MECLELRDKLVLYIKGELPQRVNARIEEHLEECDRCGEIYEEEKVILSGLGEPPQFGVSMPDIEELLADKEKNNKKGTLSLIDEILKYPLQTAFAASISLVIGLSQIDWSMIGLFDLFEILPGLNLF